MGEGGGRREGRRDEGGEGKIKFRGSKYPIARDKEGLGGRDKEGQGGTREGKVP
jgi:hypothetical protein